MTVIIYGTVAIDGQWLQRGFTNLRQHAANTLCRTKPLMERMAMHRTSLMGVTSHMNPPNDMKRLPEAGSLIGTLHNYRRRRCTDDRDRA
ncbi:hypothetical protein CH63R_06014 [Colletotrichum higginsianum IMI 349063]|uniref:Uncharacterized protein n=1 Tax=Colletotrichum higginsianum (strain IMI 349063) TaxID=759273 RepID=A0A1B7YE68_COLHI|nr:hypothetical protein CH63R_06014 [Colletotrichum higginsianum IMI 349063]OBR10322.1 hypothetical protein CH63R_06014 [Colletotrichum higginsianum IMI 349063]